MTTCSTGNSHSHRLGCARPRYTFTSEPCGCANRRFLATSGPRRIRWPAVTSPPRGPPMLDDLAGKRTGERIQILRERKGLTRPVLAGLVGMSASWLKGIEQGRRLPPRLPVLVKLAEALAVGDVAVLAGTDMDLGGAASVPVASFARIPHDAVPAIREAVRDPLLPVPAGPTDVAALAARTADAWLLWHQSTEHRTDV